MNAATATTLAIFQIHTAREIAFAEALGLEETALEAWEHYVHNKGSLADALAAGTAVDNASKFVEMWDKVLEIVKP